MSNVTLRASAIRWLKFNFVGAIGIGVQLAALALLTTLGVGYLAATALAVESAVLHNFIWHEHFTWGDRVRLPVRWGDMAPPPAKRAPWRAAIERLVRFNLTTGAVSILGNLALMGLLVGQFHVPAVVANLFSICACSLINFLVSDRWVFRTSVWRPESRFNRPRTFSM